MSRRTPAERDTDLAKFWHGYLNHKTIADVIERLRADLDDAEREIGELRSMVVWGDTKGEPCQPK